VSFQFDVEADLNREFIGEEAEKPKGHAQQSAGARGGWDRSVA
jgi:hypothetical protein